MLGLGGSSVEARPRQPIQGAVSTIARSSTVRHHRDGVSLFLRAIEPIASSGTRVVLAPSFVDGWMPDRSPTSDGDMSTRQDRDFSPVVLMRLARSLKPMELDAGDEALRQGEMVLQVYFVVRGRIEAYMQETKDGVVAVPPRGAEVGLQRLSYLGVWGPGSLWGLNNVVLGCHAEVSLSSILRLQAPARCRYVPNGCREQRGASDGQGGDDGHVGLIRRIHPPNTAISSHTADAAEPPLPCEK